MLKWLDKNKEWLFQGVGVAILSATAWLATSLWNNLTRTATETETLLLGILMAICVALVGIFLFLLYQAFQAHRSRNVQMEQLNSMEKIIRSLEAPRRFNNWDQVQPDIRRIIDRSFEDFESTELQVLGVALHVSWKTVRECIERYQEKHHGKLPRAVISLKILSPHWRDWDKLGDEWIQRSISLHINIANFLVSIRGDPNLKLLLYDYDYPPNWHGVLINGQHLYRSSCLYRNNKFTVHKNPYVYFRREDNYYSDMQISEFSYWFGHEARARTLGDLHDITKPPVTGWGARS
ncbi:hypothetical protein [Nitrosospira sp. Is2]|uniref:hypothetical protein n=1 Tax=Nitrosospira sp. Is2 TaxID=3080532 RepID=UPI002955400D|nr:hypothetical protein [Nitrosospira sp. Is2]WON74225.1 hypothetical protein R5L00_01670 [Nitrosospira sp. Is2]